MSEQQRAHSVTAYTGPLNAVKVDLGLLILLSLPVWAVVERMVADADGQLLWLLAYSGVAALWLAARIRWALGRALGKEEQHHGAQ